MTIIVYSMECYQRMKVFGKLDTGASVYSYFIENENIFAEI
jgi:hypothetical protein